MRNLLLNQEIPKITLWLLLATALALVAGCGKGATSRVASLSLVVTPAMTVKSGDSTSATITVTVLDASNMMVPGAIVTLTADTGTLSAPAVATDTQGQATFTFSSGTTSQTNRTATITATAENVTANLSILIEGSKLTANPTTLTVTADGSGSESVDFSALDAGGNPISGIPVTLTQSGTGAVTFTAPSTTNSSGNFSVLIAGTAAGTTIVTARAAGMVAASVDVTVSLASSAFAISETQLNAASAISNPTAVAMQIGDTLTVTVNAPTPTANVLFITTLGSWANSDVTQTIAVSGGKARAMLYTAASGIADITVQDGSLTDALKVSMVPAGSAIPSTITLQANPTVVSVKGGTSTLLATVTDALGNAVSGVPVAYTIINPSGGGEAVSSVAYTLASGQASATFTVGTLPSPPGGDQIRAQVLGYPAVSTTAANDTATSTNSDAPVVIGGSRTLEFGRDTQLASSATPATYTQTVSVLVTDAHGNPAPDGTIVNLSIWPIAWSTGNNCVYDNDGTSIGTFLNEDANENSVLNTGEDGSRKYFSSRSIAPGTGTTDFQLTPPSSAAGTIPTTATIGTGANGLATFNLTYDKSKAIWTVVRLRASAVLTGSTVIGETIFRLPALKADIAPCAAPLSPNSPYNF